MYKAHQIIRAVLVLVSVGLFLLATVGCSPDFPGSGNVIPNGMAIEDGVMFSIDKPLEGKYVEDKVVKIYRGDLGIDLDINIKGKKMIRQDKSSPWRVDKDALPEEIKKYWNAVTI